MALAPSDFVEIRVKGLPVLCLDTCAALDLLRDITRTDVNLNNLQAGLVLLASAENSGLVVLIAEQARIELNQHVSAIQKGTADAILNHRNLAKKIDDIAKLYGAKGVTETSHLVGHDVRAKDVVDRLIAVAKPVTGSNVIAGKALLRVNLARTPSAHGKQSMKDCVIVETYLEAASELRTATFPGRIVFLSSNTKDYYEPMTNHIAPDLNAEFQPLAIGFAPNWSAAKHLLGF